MIVYKLNGTCLCASLEFSLIARNKRSHSSLETLGSISRNNKCKTKNKMPSLSSNTGRRDTEIIAKTNKKCVNAGIKKVTQVWEVHYITG